VQDAAVEKNVGNQLPQIKIVRDEVRIQSELGKNRRLTGGYTIENLQDVYEAANNDQGPYRWRPAAWPNSAK